MIFVMNSWFEAQGVENVIDLTDGNGEFTELVGASVAKANLGFGIRSWRYVLWSSMTVLLSQSFQKKDSAIMLKQVYEISTLRECVRESLKPLNKPYTCVIMV